MSRSRTPVLRDPLDRTPAILHAPQRVQLFVGSMKHGHNISVDTVTASDIEVIEASMLCGTLQIDDTDLGCTHQPAVVGTHKPKARFGQRSSYSCPPSAASRIRQALSAPSADRRSDHGGSIDTSAPNRHRTLSSPSVTQPELQQKLPPRRRQPIPLLGALRCLRSSQLKPSTGNRRVQIVVEKGRPMRQPHERH